MLRHLVHQATDVDPVRVCLVPKRHRVRETLDAANAGQARNLAVYTLQQQQVVALEEVAVGLERDHEDLVVAEFAYGALVDGARRVATREQRLGRRIERETQAGWIEAHDGEQRRERHDADAREHEHGPRDDEWRTSAQRDRECEQQHAGEQRAKHGRVRDQPLHLRPPAIPRSALRMVGRTRWLRPRDLRLSVPGARGILRARRIPGRGAVW